MKVISLTIKNFRNIKDMDFKPCDGANVIYGDNAQGKTNLLEALWLFSGTRSFRGSKDAELTTIGEKNTRLELNFFAQNREKQSVIGLFGDKKTVHLNEIKQESIAKLAGEFCAVVFSPDHLSLVKQGPDKRRRLIDNSLTQAYPKYLKLLDGYNRILKQRNVLLKDMEKHPALADTLDTWDESIIEYGAYITSMRSRYIKKLAVLANNAYNGISSGKETFSAIYMPGFNGYHDGQSRDEIREALKKAIQNSRTDDIRAGITTQGPHRDDLEITVNGLSARTFGSQGQQRSCVLALKLAECGILEERNKEPPAVLLDDVMSELDAVRRDYLLNQLTGKQTFITCCDADMFAGLSGGQVFNIKNGVLE